MSNPQKEFELDYEDEEDMIAHGHVNMMFGKPVLVHKAESAVAYHHHSSHPNLVKREKSTSVGRHFLLFLKFSAKLHIIF